ncbi:hypothetical protein [Aeromonas veronii]|uniref:hypothetical protein n=1 Tax=Aeromonas veronii TaxID=654 RepID=UPI001F2303FF|nr:hypothetical protein [Aeromonas veronii]
MIMGMRVGMAVVMRVGMIMLMVVGVIMVVLMGLIMTLCTHGGPYTVIVVMDIPLMVIVVVNDQRARGTLLVVMVMMRVMGMIVLVAMFMVVIMIVCMVVIVGVGMVVIIFMAGDPRLAASAYATHINLPRCR